MQLKSISQIKSVISSPSFDSNFYFNFKSIQFSLSTQSYSCIYHNISSQTNQLSREIQAFVTLQREVPKMATETTNERTNKEVETSICTFSNLLIFGTTTEVQHETNLAYTMHGFHLPPRNPKWKLLVLPVPSKLTTTTYHQK